MAIETYPISANISKFEWRVVQAIRHFVRPEGFGSVKIVFRTGQAYQLLIENSVSPTELKELQS
jgi:hypothetical protein